MLFIIFLCFHSFGHFCKLKRESVRFLLGFLRDCGWELGRAGHIHSKRLRTLAFDKFEKESDSVTLTCISFVGHVVVLDAGVVSEIVQQHVILSRKQSHAVDLAYHVVHHSLRDCIAIKSRCASAELIENG